MAPIGRHRSTHEIDIDAPADVVYGIIADAANWPQHFSPTIHVERREVDDSTELLSIWASANGEVKSWTSRRVLDAAARRIEFRQEVSTPPVASMGGQWTVIETSADASKLVLEHDFDAVDDDPAGIKWITDATDRNSNTELANIKALAEDWASVDELVFSFEDSVVVEGPLDKAYEFLYQAWEWPTRLPHVSRLDLQEDVKGLQVMSMDTSTKDGSTHTTESVRVCFPNEQRIVYKQLVTPSLMTAHTGEWTIRPDGEGLRATSKHTVTLNEKNISNVLGADATTGTARAFLRKAVGGNSAATLALTKEFTEAGNE